MFLISRSFTPAWTLIQKAELEMRVASSPFRLMDAQDNGDEGLMHSPAWAEAGEGTAVVELQMLLGILHQSEQLAFAKLEFLSPGCTWQCRNFSPSSLPFSSAPRSAAELAPAFQLYFSFLFSLSIKSKAASVSSSWPALSERQSGGCWWLSTALLTPLSCPANAVWGKVGLELLKGNDLVWYGRLAENWLVGHRISSRFRKNGFLPRAK